MSDSPATVFEVRQGRNMLALAVLVPLTIAALAVGVAESSELGLQHWWIAVFPILAIATAYRLIRRRTPIVIDADGLRLATGHTLLGLKTTVPWSQVKRMRITAAGLLLIELRNAEAWAQDKPWLVRANLRTNERKFGAAVVQPLRELAGTPQEILLRLRAVSPVRIDAPEALKVAP